MWQPSDVWILRSLGGGPSLRGVIATADYLDHSVPDEDELTGAVSRLVAAGLAGCDTDRCWLTPAGVASPAHKGTFTAAMAALPPLPPGPAPWTLPPGLYRTTVDAYLNP